MIDPKDFGLSAEQIEEKKRGYLSLSARDRKIMLQLINNEPIDDILFEHGLTIDELKKICRKRSAISYREYEERKLLKHYGYTRENVIRGLCDIAFTRIDDLANWDASEVTLKDSDFVSASAKNAVAEVQAQYFKGEKVVKIKMHDKIAALNSLLKTFDGDDKHDELDRSGIETLLAVLNATRQEASKKDHGSGDGQSHAVEAVCGTADNGDQLPGG